VGTASQQLTIDTVPPVITINGGAFSLTNDPTPTISGTSDVAAGTVIYVGVGSQNLSALVQHGGTWNVAATALTDGVSTVTATVTDPADNQSTAIQSLTVDTIAPAVSITGGANALTNDSTPVISGTANVPPGTTVTVALADQTLDGLVQAGGNWSVTAGPLSDGPHRVVMSVFDPAGNLATLTQTLTVDTVAPLITIAGGPTATTNNLEPTITGTSNAAPGTTITITIAGQTLTTLLQANGTWNATPTLVGAGAWHIIASAPDPAGNVGEANETLTIDGNASSIAAGSASVTALAESASVWREAGTSALVGRSRVPIGTTFSFKLNEKATVTLTFSQTARGRKIGGRCVALTAKNSHGPSCTHTIAAGELKLAGRKGVNTIHFEGRLTRTHTLKPGHYTLKITTTNTAGRHTTSKPRSFTIVK
jgi:hypothetical protein